MARKKVNIQYRKLADLTGGFGTASLQSALEQAMATPVADGSGSTHGQKVEKRVMSQVPYGTLVLNHFEPRSEFFFGEIVRFEPGADLPLLNMAGAELYNLAQSKAPAGHEPVRGVLYFMVFGNHVMLLENDCASGRAEKYLTWLLTQCGVIASNAQVILDAELQTADGESELSSVDQVTIRPAPVAPSDAGADLVEYASTASRDAKVLHSRALDVLKAAGMAETDIIAITAHDTSIEVTLQVRFKTKRRRQAVVMADAKRLLRNVDDDDLTLSGVGGRQKGGKIVKLSHRANVLVLGSLLDLGDTARALSEAYQFFVGNGYIEG